MKALTPEQAEAARVRANAYYWAHRETRLAQAKESRARRTPEQRARRNEVSRALRRANPDREREYQRRYVQKTGGRAQREWRQRHPERVRDFRLMKEYGITHADFEAMLVLQNGLCAICKQQESFRLPDQSVSPLVVDHNHATGRVRALLCRACNSALGLFAEDEDRLTAALAYLRDHR